MGRIHHRNPCGVNTQLLRFFGLSAEPAQRPAGGADNPARNGKTRTDMPGFQDRFASRGVTGGAV
ncbi:hypothetical protein HOE425_310013 [Hoeflea sp. EC-HK425]|nr:hypothetical protein HOE425_310013 [Hoeflea sp. EC-HK425]